MNKTRSSRKAASFTESVIREMTREAGVTVVPGSSFYNGENPSLFCENIALFL